jgi:hypothetical protein
MFFFHVVRKKKKCQGVLQVDDQSESRLRRFIRSHKFIRQQGAGVCTVDNLQHLSVWVSKDGKWYSLKDVTVEEILDQVGPQRSVCTTLLTEIFGLSARQAKNATERFFEPQGDEGVYADGKGNYAIVVKLPDSGWDRHDTQLVGTAAAGLLLSGLASFAGYHTGQRTGYRKSQVYDAQPTADAPNDPRPQIELAKSMLEITRLNKANSVLQQELSLYRQLYETIRGEQLKARDKLRVDVPPDPYQKNPLQGRVMELEQKNSQLMASAQKNQAEWDNSRRNNQLITEELQLKNKLLTEELNAIRVRHEKKGKKKGVRGAEISLHPEHELNAAARAADSQ